MRDLLICLVLAAMVAGCAPRPPDDGFAADVAASETVDEADAAAEPLEAIPPPPEEARTAEALDTTTPEQRAEAAAVPELAAAQVLGTTVVSLGSPTEPGFWLKTPLVKSEARGRVTNPTTGKSSQVTLIPIDGPETAGSRMSLPAMRLIEASLTDLTEVEVSLEG